MATVADSAGEKNFVEQNHRTDLTPTALLMEGLYTQISTSFDSVISQAFETDRKMSDIAIYHQLTRGNPALQSITTQPAEAQAGQEPRMQRYIFQDWQAVVVVGVSLLGFSLTASSQQETSAAGGPHPSSFTIQAVSRTVKAGSPVWVDITEKNNSDQTLPFGRARPAKMDQGGEIYIVDAVDENGLRPIETTFYRRKLGHLTPDELAHLPLPMGSGVFLFVKPGESITDRIDVGRLYDLSRPGTYTIQVRFPTPTNKINVTVTP